MPTPTWQQIVASSLDWDQAHVSLDDALEGLAAAGRAARPEGYPHSVWQLLDHIRRAQHDLLDFCINDSYSHNLTWPDDYWSSNPTPPSDAAWSDCVKQIKDDRDQLARFTTSGSVDLTQAIPHGDGQTYLRTVLVAVDHAAYHLGQIVDVRRLNGDWPPA
jgi:hypothetical protein